MASPLTPFRRAPTDATASTEITFCNRSKRAIRVYWLRSSSRSKSATSTSSKAADDDGSSSSKKEGAAEVFYMRVEPMQDRIQGTGEGHEWVVREDDGSSSNGEARTGGSDSTASVVGRVVLVFSACAGKQTAWVVPLKDRCSVKVLNQIGLPLEVRILRCKLDSSSPRALIRDQGAAAVAGDDQQQPMILPHSSGPVSEVKLGRAVKEGEAEGAIVWMEMVVRGRAPPPPPPSSSGAEQEQEQEQEEKTSTESSPAPPASDLRIAVVGFSRVDPPRASKLRRVGVASDADIWIRGNRVAIPSDKVYRSHICGQAGGRRESGKGATSSSSSSSRSKARFHGFVVNTELTPTDVCGKHPDLLPTLNQQLAHLSAVLPPKAAKFLAKNMQLFVNTSYHYKFRYDVLQVDEASGKLQWVPSDTVEEEEAHGSCCHTSREWLVSHGSPAYKTGHVEIYNSVEFLSQTSWKDADQPAQVLHELSHAWHAHFEAEVDSTIREAYAKAVAARIYDRIPHVNGRVLRHYALENHLEYFSESSEAFFSSHLFRNDYFPFTRLQLKEYDPHGFEMCRRAWSILDAPEERRGAGEGGDSDSSISTAATAVPDCLGEGASSSAPTPKDWPIIRSRVLKYLRAAKTRNATIERMMKLHDSGGEQAGDEVAHDERSGAAATAGAIEKGPAGEGGGADSGSGSGHNSPDRSVESPKQQQDNFEIWQATLVLS